MDHMYTIRPGSVTIGPFLAGASDPDGDHISLGDQFHDRFATYPTHGSLEGVTDPNYELYIPNTGYVGSDSFLYRVCDDLGSCSTATVTLFVVSDGANLGVAACNA